MECKIEGLAIIPCCMSTLCCAKCILLRCFQCPDNALRVFTSFLRYEKEVNCFSSIFPGRVKKEGSRVKKKGVGSKKKGSRVKKKDLGSKKKVGSKKKDLGSKKRVAHICFSQRNWTLVMKS